jgi:hypothetical protein
VLKLSYNNENKVRNELVSTLDQNVKNSISHSTSPANSQQKGVLTLRKHSMDYFTRDGVILRTGYDNIVYWYLLCLKELWDDAADFLTKHYKDAEDTQIITKIHKDDTDISKDNPVSNNC